MFYGPYDNEFLRYLQDRYARIEETRICTAYYDKEQDRFIMDSCVHCCARTHLQRITGSGSVLWVSLVFNEAERIARFNGRNRKSY